MGNDAARAIDWGGREYGQRGVGVVTPSHLTSNAIQRGQLVQLKLPLRVIGLHLLQQWQRSGGVGKNHTVSTGQFLSLRIQHRPLVMGPFQ